MAIDSFEKEYDKFPLKHSTNILGGSVLLPSHYLLKPSINTDDNTTSSSDSKSVKLKKNRNTKSPYLIGDNAQAPSRVSEKKLYLQHKKVADFASAFPMTTSIYRTNSDEFKSQKRGNKKVKKSVLTLPNVPTMIPQTGVKKDAHEFKYFETEKKRMTQQKKSRVINKDYEPYDRYARFFSGMDMFNNHNNNSTGSQSHFTGDGKRINRKLRARKESAHREPNQNDIWTVIRDINQLHQFEPSPTMSEDSVPVTNKKIKNKRKNNRKDNRINDNCRAEELRYLSGENVGNKSLLGCSDLPSIDPIATKNKQFEFKGIFKEFENSILKTQNINQRKNRRFASNKSQNRKNAKNNHSKIIVCKENNGRPNLQCKLREIKQSEKKKGAIHAYKNTTHVNNVDKLESLVNYKSNSLQLRKNYTKKSNKFITSTDLCAKFNPSKGSNSLQFGYGKAAVIGSTIIREDCRDKLLKAASNEFGHVIKGMTKMIISKGQSLMLPKGINETQTRKPRLEPSLSRAGTMSKLTQTEIKRQSSNTKVRHSASFQTDCVLYTISELSHCESQDIFKPALPSSTNTAPKLLTLLEGVFLSDAKAKRLIQPFPVLSYTDNTEEKNMLLELKLSIQRLLPYYVNPAILNINDYCRKRAIPNNSYYFNNDSCTVLEFYKNAELALNMKNQKAEISIFPFIVTVNDNGYYYIEDEIINKQLNAIEYNPHLSKTEAPFNQIMSSACNLKIRKNKFVKLIKKCKTTSCREESTSLSKINNLEDFLQALGTGKILSSIFDEVCTNKILTSLKEMKNWVTEINQKQAMLVLLLSNKKDTPNLVRFRPLLLQGIAVNRITRASELDMEIEVIETENFHNFWKISDYQKRIKEVSDETQVCTKERS